MTKIIIKFKNYTKIKVFLFIVAMSKKFYIYLYIFFFDSSSCNSTILNIFKYNLTFLKLKYQIFFYCNFFSRFNSI